MTRSLPAGMATAVAAQTGTVCHLLALEFSGGTVYLTTASRDLSWDGHTWEAVGGHLEFEPIAESVGVAEGQVALTLDGVEQTIIADLLSYYYVGRDCSIYLAHLDSTGAIISDPVLLFAGMLNGEWTIEQNETTCRVRTIAVSFLGWFQQSRGLRADDTIHQTQYDGDGFWSHIAALAGRRIVWGPDDSAKGGGFGGGGGGGGGDGDGDEPRERKLQT